jgi:hypothetical protein
MKPMIAVGAWHLRARAQDIAERIGAVQAES